MNKLTVQISRYPLFYLRLMYAVQKYSPMMSTPSYATAVDVMDAFSIQLRNRQKVKARTSFDISKLTIRYYMDADNPRKAIANMTIEELDKTMLQLMSRNKDKKLLDIIEECREVRKRFNDDTLKKLFRHYSIAGKTDVVDALIKYASITDPYLFKRNGGFAHYIAKSQCMRGNAEKGLSILRKCYLENESLRSFYRIIFRELIQDTVLNRSEASLVIFKKYVLEFSDKFGDHYPLVCFWHLCWASSWFSDQILSGELLETSTVLQDIVRDKATAFSITALRHDYNEDAVVRLLQALLKYHLMDEYVKVLQVLFSHKLKNRDLRGCTEIIKNCEMLGVELPSDQQGRYIKMLIDGKSVDHPTPPKPPNFKLKF